MQRKWFTIMVDGHPVDGSTNDEQEARAWLARANQFYEGEAYMITTYHPLAW